MGGPELRSLDDEGLPIPPPVHGKASRAVLPVLFHLMWRRVLAADLSSGPLSSSSLVWLAAGAR
jgi:hypothetical protein